MEMLRLSQLRASDLERPDVRFTDDNFVYSTSGLRLATGGMGNVWTVTRVPAERPDAAPELVVAKTFRDEFLILLREDPTARRRFDHFEQVLEVVKTVDHPNVLPVLLVSPIADNYLIVSPLAGQSLFGRLSGEMLSPRDRIRLLSTSLRGLSALHRRGMVHRDYTLLNVLTARDQSATVFDFDLSVVPQLLPMEERTYAGYYQSRISGSPEYSIAPELVDDVLAREPISPRVDVYAVGTALYGLFTDESIYGPVPDMSTLLYCIAEGMVHRRQSRVRYPDAVPLPLRPIIDTCLEREPQARYPDAGAVADALETVDAELSVEHVKGRMRTTARVEYTQASIDFEQVFDTRSDPSISRDDMERMRETLARHGYLLEKSLGRVKGHPIYLVMPDPELVAAGRFPDDNTYRKVVTAIDVSTRPDLVETWLARIHPIVNRVRQGFLTSLYKVVHEKQSQQLLLLSEYVADPRFGSDLDGLDLSLEEALGLGLIVALSIARLHELSLAHNNVRPQSLMFQGRRDVGIVQPFFVGLVEPSFDPQVRVDDVQQLARFIGSLIRQPRIDALRAERRPSMERLRYRLELTVAGSQQPSPTIHQLIDLLSDGLSAIEPNFDIVRSNGGDVASFADLLVRHSLYNKLYALNINDT